MLHRAKEILPSATADFALDLAIQSAMAASAVVRIALIISRAFAASGYFSGSRAIFSAIVSSSGAISAVALVTAATLA